MRYDIEGDWYLLDTCNYRCSYCFSSEATLGRKLRVSATVEEWRNAFDATGLTWLVHLSGGEPTIYPDFAGLCTELTKRNFISFNSNLTHASVPVFAERVDPRRVSFINAGFHPAERQRRQGAAKFLKNLEALKANGFPVFVSVVATPAALADMEGIAEILRPAGVAPIPKVLRGMFQGQRYPEAYTAAEREKFRSCAKRARESYADDLAMLSEPPSINMFADDEILFGEPSFRGRSCLAGSRFVRIGAAGEVSRCNSRKRMGNLLDGTFRPSPGAAPCDTSYCFYFCRKYASAAEPRATVASRVRTWVGSLGPAFSR